MLKIIKKHSFFILLKYVISSCFDQRDTNLITFMPKDDPPKNQSSSQAILGDSKASPTLEMVSALTLDLANKKEHSEVVIWKDWLAS